ncbi:hypothetical protein NVP1161O_182 [Vibrio phage 1.161.O._10N.261.48.C5]|nr:hypothetical protein NVP1161O_182 [Vibrio phage 1.161.O._10N.261.48.C5]
MLLSNKYRVVEDTTQITLFQLETKDILDDDKNPTGETKVVEKGIGFYSRSATGRSQCYNRLINCEVSAAETLQEILDTVKRCEEQCIEFWKEQQ